MGEALGGLALPVAPNVNPFVNEEAPLRAAMAGKLGPSLGCSEGEGARVTRVKQMPRQANGCDCVSDFRSLSLATLLAALLFAG